MPMNRNELLDAIIDDGIHEIETNYLRLDQKQKREGGIAGFNACRGKTDTELLSLHQTSLQNTRASMMGSNVVIADINTIPSLEKITADASNDQYWFYRYFDTQVEWVLNVLSSAMYHHGQTPLIPPSLRGSLKAANILNGDTLS